MRVALTGATGFLGRSLVPALLLRGHAVRALVREGRDAGGALLRDGVELVRGALDAPPDPRWLDGADVLVHLAARGVQSRERDWPGALDVNVTRSVALAREARERGVARVVVTGTCLEYRGHGRLPDAPLAPSGAPPLCDEDAPTEPADAYGATKAAGGVALRAWAREASVPLRYLRVASLYGPGDDPAKFLPSATRALRGGAVFEMSAGAQVREWLHLDDAVDALVRATEAPFRGVETLNVGTGAGIALRDLVARVALHAGADPSLIRATRPYRRDEPHHLVMRVARAHDDLGWSARTALDDGLRALLAAC